MAMAAISPVEVVVVSLAEQLPNLYCSVDHPAVPVPEVAKEIVDAHPETAANIDSSRIAASVTNKNLRWFIFLLLFYIGFSKGARGFALLT